MKKLLLLLPLAVLCAFAECNPDQELERLNWVRERLKPDTPEPVLKKAAMYLKIATQGCSTNGDLWYYRWLVEKKISNGVETRDTKYSLKQATEYTSEAMARKMDPFTASQAARPATLSKFVREKWAVLIGVGAFQDPGARPLKFTVKDAEDMKRILIDERYGRFKPDNVKVVVDGGATVQGIKEAIGWLRENAKQQDLVLIYMSSHGSPRQMDSQGVSYIIAHNTVLAPPAKLYATSYQMIDLVQDINRDVPAGRLVLVLDACHSGAAVEQGAKSLTAQAASASAYSVPLEMMQSGVGRAILTASRAEEQSWESPNLDNGQGLEKGNGFFTYFLKQSLQQDKGLWDLKKVCGYVKEKVPAAVNKERQAAQNPTCTFSDGGDGIVLGVAPNPGSQAGAQSPVRRNDN